MLVEPSDSQNRPLPELDQLTRLESEIDFRIRSIWDKAYGTEVTLASFGKFMRAAYGQGYVDALKERERGQLCREFGYRVPRIVD